MRASFDYAEGPLDHRRTKVIERRLFEGIAAQNNAGTKFEAVISCAEALTPGKCKGVPRRRPELAEARQLAPCCCPKTT